MVLASQLAGLAYHLASSLRMATVLEKWEHWSQMHVGSELFAVTLSKDQRTKLQEFNMDMMSKLYVFKATVTEQ